MLIAEGVERQMAESEPPTSIHLHRYACATTSSELGRYQRLEYSRGKEGAE